jgi:2'-5' RNA ligase
MTVANTHPGGDDDSERSLKDTDPVRPGDPLILSLTMDDLLFNMLDKLRREFFPAERNCLRAHLTLFHQLPGFELAAISQHLQSVCNTTSSFELRVPEVRFLGKGVAAAVVSPRLFGLHADLSHHWQHHLTAQDRQRFSPHVTIQNKVNPAVARELFETLSKRWVCQHGQAVGLSLWWYRGGPWEPAGQFNFRA